eukprot:365610-Chlamydomonas_euryale.AAC.4
MAAHRRGVGSIDVELCIRQSAPNCRPQLLCQPPGRQHRCVEFKLMQAPIASNALGPQAWSSASKLSSSREA